MKVAFITDTHWGVRNDSPIFHEYFAKFYTDIFFPYLKENNITTVYHLGDIVDRRKFINFVTLHQFKKQFIVPCVENNIDLHVIVGNHDVPYRNTNKINAMQEIFGEHYHNKGMHFYADPKEIECDGTKLAMLPWINNENYEESMEFIKNTQAQVLLGHLELAGFQMYQNGIASGGLDSSIFKKFDQVYTGHFHHKSTKENVTYLGTPYELNWNDWNDRRGFHIFDTDTRELEFIHNPNKMFHKLWYDDKDKTFEDVMNVDFTSYRDNFVKIIVQNKENPYWFDLYTDKLHAVNPYNVTIVDDHLHHDIEEDSDITAEAEDTLTILNNYVEAMDTKVDKIKIHEMLTRLYNDAQHMEG